MKRFVLSALFIGASFLAACGGGGSGSSPGVPGTRPTNNPSAPPQVKATPTASGYIIEGHAFTGFDKKLHIAIFPHGNPPVLPPGATDNGPLARAIVIYPDGSKQIADAHGAFVPSQSTYAQKHQALLASNAQAQPSVIIIDPRGVVSPLYATVPAYTLAAGLIQRRALNAAHTGPAVRMATAANITNLAGITLLPQQYSMLSTGILYLNVLGTDANNNVVDLTGSQITWYANDGGVTPLQNPTSAYYFPPALSSGSVNDSITVGVQIGGDPNNVFYASVPVNVISSASAATVSGTVSVNGTAVPSALAVFAQAAPSTLFTPTLWLAQADANGNYVAEIPASSNFSLGIGIDAPFSPSGSYGVYVAQQPNGTDAYRSLAQGTSDGLNLTLDPATIQYSFASPYDTGSVPSYVSFIRNGWFAAHDAVLNRIFEADSGIQSILQNVPTSFPMPANPAPVGTGQYARWCYQWQTIGGAPTLVVIDNSDTTCTAPGNDAYTISPTGNQNFSYAHFASSTVFPIIGTVDVVTNSVLVEGGTWSQNVTMNGSGAIAADTVSVSGGFYDINNQSFGSPVYSENMTYQYNASGSSSSETFAETRISSFTGTTISQLNAQASQAASLSSCVGTSSACFTITGTEQADIDGSGTLDGSFTISDTLNGDGSASLIFTSTTPGDASKLVLPLSSDTYGNAHNCIVCSNAGSVYDTDGVTNLGTVQIDNTLLTKVIIYDTPSGSPALGPDQIDSFGFVL